jgi:hypothetical protein
VIEEFFDRDMKKIGIGIIGGCGLCGGAASPALGDIL